MSSSTTIIFSKNWKLLDAIDANNLSTMKTLISNKHEHDRHSSPSPLIHAAECGNLDAITLLLDANCADIDASDEYYSSACHAAVCYGHFAALQLLVQRGANVRTVRPRNDSLLRAAMQFADERVEILLLDAGAPLDHLTDDELILLATHRHSDSLLTSLLARKSVDFTAVRDKNGNTLCHYVIANAARGADVNRFVRVLVGADPDATNVRGETALHIAAANHNFNAMRLLLELGADIARKRHAGVTVLHQLCDDNSVVAANVELLLALGADVHAVDHYGRTACHFAARAANVNALCAALAAGGDLEQADKYGFSPRSMTLESDFRPSCLPTAAKIEAARRRIPKARLDVVRARAVEICVGLQSLKVNALQLCEIMMHSFGALGSLILFHQWWAIATTVRHFHDRKKQ